VLFDLTRAHPGVAVDFLVGIEERASALSGRGVAYFSFDKNVFGISLLL
jgi:hypothetical protein